MPTYSIGALKARQSDAHPLIQNHVESNAIIAIRTATPCVELSLVGIGRVANLPYLKGKRLEKAKEVEQQVLEIECEIPWNDPDPELNRCTVSAVRVKPTYDSGTMIRGDPISRLHSSYKKTPIVTFS